MAPSSKVLGAFLLLAVLVGCAAAGSYVNVFGDRVYHAKNRKEYIRTYVRLPRDHDSRTAPTAVGVEWTVGFLKNINRLEPTINQPIENGTFQFVAYEQKMRLPLAGGSPFQFVKLGWNYNGHPPVGIYDIPHADMHFMFPSVEEWHSYYDPTNMGPCGGANQTLFLAATQPLLKKCFPGGGYMNVGNFVWDHGIHNYDVTGPEFNPAPKHFNQTLIYGTHGGKIAFMEPMVGAAMMMKQGKTCYDIRSTLPQEWPTARYIPTEYCLSNNGRTFNTEFRRFKWMTAGCVKGEQDAMVSWPEDVPVPGAEAGCMAAMP